jgi:hypothetical protein
MTRIYRKLLHYLITQLIYKSGIKELSTKLNRIIRLEDSL